jgi:hypothetical protein
LPRPSAANAALSGAKTVIDLAELSVRVSPAVCTACTSSESSGLCDAAVATGAAAIALKLLMPVAGILAQAVPKAPVLTATPGPVAAGVPDPVAGGRAEPAAAGLWLGDEDAGVLLEVQAAAARLMQMAAVADTPMVLDLTKSPPGHYVWRSLDRVA